MQVDVLNIEGKQTGRTVELPEEIFGIEPNDHVIYLAVKQYQGAQRQGSHKVKTRAEVKGSSKKLHKQKGTGGARKVTCVTLCITVVVLFLDQSHTNTTSN